MMKSLFRPLLLLVLVATVVAATVLVLYHYPELMPGEYPPAAEQAPPDAAAPATPAEPVADTGESRRDHRLRFDDLEKLLTGVERDQREQLLQDEQAFRQFVRQEADNQSVIAAARDNELHKEDSVAFLMQRGADSVLSQTYLSRLMREQLRPDFPTREEAREFYEQNPERFQVGERIQVWQVYLQVGPGAAEEDAAGIEARARDIRDRLRAGELDFATAAIEYSDHEPSRQNGGFMGAVRVADLKPDIARVIGGMDAGDIELARSDDGWHVIRKGEITPPERLDFEQIEDQVRQLLVNQARREFREAVISKARETYPHDDLSEQRIEEWRLQLRTADREDWAR